MLDDSCGGQLVVWRAQVFAWGTPRCTISSPGTTLQISLGARCFAGVNLQTPGPQLGPADLFGYTETWFSCGRVGWMTPVLGGSCLSLS
jgi:hypothetical protein